jgi:lysophospholipase L1-like esterase
MTDTENKPAPDQPVAQGKVEVDQLVRRLRELGVKLNDENILNALIAQLSSSPSFIRLVRNLTLEGLAEHVADRSRDMPDIPTVHDNNQVKGYSAKVHEERSPDTLIKVGILSQFHPKHPNGLDIYALRRGTQEQWENLHLSEAAEQAIRLALAQVNAEEGIYYWVELVVYTDHPLNENTLPVGDGSATAGYAHAAVQHEHQDAVAEETKVEPVVEQSDEPK